ncbi:hypothetical protein B9Z19DRAFT_1133002 [Tuber borchii]|uniref:Uncharacterized protein n=1 Tax=Tuber borchii TaxID=42251 RepID=A0A2T6ZGL0_TUBBO|nr:hypothetical protein B9Z19DRAFT_1133002 [Tuber borchii]
MVTGTNKQANASHKSFSQNLRSVDIQDLWSHDQRHVSNTGSRGLAYCSPPLGPGGGGPATSASSIENCARGANEVEVVERTTQSITGAQKTGDCGRGSFLAVYCGLGWNDSLAMLNWRLQEAYAEKAQFATVATGATASSSVLSTAMPSDLPEAIPEEIIAEEAVEMEAISPLELEPCYSTPSSDGPNGDDGGPEGNNPQKASVSFPPPENSPSESAPSAPLPEDIYNSLGWTGRLKVLNRSLQETYEKNDTDNPNNSPIDTTRPQINFYAQDPPVLPRSFPPGLPLSISDLFSPPNTRTQQPSLHYQQEVYPTHEPNWGPYPYPPQQSGQVPHHLFCPSAAHAITCGGIFVDPRAVAAIDHVVYNSAMLMFENFRRQFLAMEGRHYVGWWPVQGSERGVTRTLSSAVNDPTVFGHTPEERGANREMGKAPHEETHEEVTREARVGNRVEASPTMTIQNTFTNSTSARPVTTRSTMQGSSTQADTEAVRDQFSVKETLNASAQTKVTEIASTRNFGVQINDPKVIPRNKTVNSSTQTTSTKTRSIGTSTNAESLPARVHSAPETQSQPPATKKRKHKRKNKAKTNTSEVAKPPPPSPPPPPPPPRPLLSTVAYGPLSIPDQTITPIAIDRVENTSPEPPIQSSEQGGGPATTSFGLGARGASAQPGWPEVILLCSFLLLFLDLVLGLEEDR